MGSIILDTKCSLSPAKMLSTKSNPPPPSVSGPPSLQRGLPDGYITRVFSSIRHLQHEAYRVLESLQQNGDGNQWLLVLGLSKPALKRLHEDHSCLGGVNYRIMWENLNALIKVVPSQRHEVVTTRVNTHMTVQLGGMGLLGLDYDWVAASKYPPCAPHSTSTPTKGKEGDQGLAPPSRMINTQGIYGWPTLVFETGVSESHSRLQEDVSWWFSQSAGDVRFVLVIDMKTSVIHFELYQLAPPNSPHPLTRQYIQSLCRQNPNMPPLTRQLVQTQQPYCSQAVTVTAAGVVGAPLILPFEALFCRPPIFPETDLVISATDFQRFATNMFT
jgi:hypothetical protein